MSPRSPLLSVTARRLVQRVGMTVCVGFHSGDSIVLCADRQITKGGVKFYECKVSWIHGGEWSLGFVYADSRELMGFIWDRLRTDTSQLTEPRFEVFRYMLEGIVQEAFAAFPDADVDILCGITISAEKCIGDQLLIMGRHGVHETQRWEFLGAGDSSLMRYLEKTFVRNLSSPEEELLLALYMASRAKSYIEGCGGETDVLIMKVGEKPRVLTRQEIYDLEKKLESLDKKLAEAFRRSASEAEA